MKKSKRIDYHSFGLFNDFPEVNFGDFNELRDDPY